MCTHATSTSRAREAAQGRHRVEIASDFCCWRDYAYSGVPESESIPES